jgi:ABC-type spermidine/putrescine transport system permease subunit I
MEYFLALVLQSLGISFHVMQKIISLGDKNKDKTRSQIFSTFLSEDWDTLFVSFLVLITCMVFHFSANYYFPESMNKIVEIPILNIEVPIVILILIASFVIGYAGQRLVYRWLGSAEKYLDKKAGD